MASEARRFIETCTVCEGEGYLPELDDDGEDVDVAAAIVCEECGGDGLLHPPERDGQ